MTLVVTALTPMAIFQSADYRLTDGDTGATISDASTKVVALQYADWHGLVAYTGVGRSEGRDTATFVKEWLSGLSDGGPAAVERRLCEAGSAWLARIGRRQAFRHSFVLAAFEAAGPRLSVISNFETIAGVPAPSVAPALSVTTARAVARPRIIVCGMKDAVDRTARRQLVHALRSAIDDPGRVRRVLAEINARAAASPAASGTVSEACSVVSFRADGQGALKGDGRVDVHSVAMGAPSPSREELAKLLGVRDIGRIVQAAFGTSKPRMPFGPCRPAIIRPAESAYTLRELSYTGLESCRATAVNDGNTVLGAGDLAGRPGVSRLVRWSPSGESVMSTVQINFGRMNGAGLVAATAVTADGALRAISLSPDGQLADLGCYGGIDSGAVDVNSGGIFAGWVCIDPNDRGQTKYRPSVWRGGQITILTDSGGCEWGQAVAVTEGGTVLVVGQKEWRSYAMIWRLDAGTVDAIGNGIYPMAINDDEVVVGRALDTAGKNVAVSWRRERGWTKLVETADVYATDINNRGDVIGTATDAWHERPWVLSAGGKFEFLPYFAEHGCRPFALNDAGTIVGSATTDHGSHALIWEDDRGA